MKKDLYIKDNMRDFRIKHPKLTRAQYMVNDFMDMLLSAYILFWGIVVGIIILAVYFNIDKEIRNEVSVITGAIVSVIVVPLAINIYNKKWESKIQRFNANEKIYNELTNILIVLVSKEQYTEKDLAVLRKYITDNYNRMCIYFSSKLITYLSLIYLYCEVNVQKMRDIFQKSV